jgi:L-gulonolactone oxidase
MNTDHRRPPWTNWAGDQVCAPREIARPTSERELAELVARAAAAGQRIRAVGSGHSFTDCACTDGVMVDTTGMQRVLDIDRDSGLVTVEGGTKLHALGPVLAEQGLALENQGDIDRQSITGAISTATHGTGARLPNIAARITALRLVTASGDALELSADTDPDAYLAARVSIGALGVVSAVTIQCVPLYTLHRHDQPLPLRDTLDRLEAHVEENDHFEFFVFPYTETALTRRTRRSHDEPSPPPHWRRQLQEEIVENRVLSAICRTGRMFPRLAPRLNKVITTAMSESRVEDRAYKVYATNREVRFTEMEYAIPRAHAREAVERVLALIERRRLPILFPLEVRFAAPDDAFLSTAFGRDTCYIAVHQYVGMEFETYFRAVEAIMDSYGGRPHWGKRHYQTAATLRERYAEWDRFQAVRGRLDPDHAFGNDYTRRVLGETAERVAA